MYSKNIIYIFAQKQFSKIMFNKYKELHARFVDYLKTQESQLNISDMEGGFQSIESISAYLYNDIPNVKLSGNIR